MYKLLTKPFPNAQYESVLRLDDGSVIPMVQPNTDYQAYLKWLSEGNQPLPADEPTGV